MSENINSLRAHRDSLIAGLEARGPTATWSDWLTVRMATDALNDAIADETHHAAMAGLSTTITKNGEYQGLTAP